MMLNSYHEPTYIDHWLFFPRILHSKKMSQGTQYNIDGLYYVLVKALVFVLKSLFSPSQFLSPADSANHFKALTINFNTCLSDGVFHRSHFSC